MRGRGRSLGDFPDELEDPDLWIRGRDGEVGGHDEHLGGGGGLDLGGGKPNQGAAQLAALLGVVVGKHVGKALLGVLGPDILHVQEDPLPHPRVLDEDLQLLHLQLLLLPGLLLCQPALFFLTKQTNKV